MMKLIPLLLVLLTSTVFAQINRFDKISGPESQARLSISKLRQDYQDDKHTPILQEVLTNLADLAARKVPFLNLNELRKGMADTASVVYINQGLRSGTFRFDPADRESEDDGSMVIVAGERRYKREDLGYLRPEWFGADPNDEQDDALAIQQMFNKATAKGLSVRFSNGIYYVGKTVSFKLVSGAPKYYNKLNIEGEGVGRTRIYGFPGFRGDMFEVNSQDKVTLGKDNYISIRNIEFRGLECSRILYFPQVTSIKLYDNMFMGGTDAGVQFGVKGGTAAYSVYLKNNYHHGGTYTGGHNNALLRLISARFFVIEGMETDGGRYGIEMIGASDNNIIANSKIEGSKKAAVYIDGNGGGKNMIYSNTFNPYVGHEPNAQFNGQIHAIEIVSNGGSNSYNKIFGNNLFVESSASLPMSAVLSQIKGNFRTAAGGFSVRGQQSGAVGQLNGYNKVSNEIVVYLKEGIFIEGEEIIQEGTKASARLKTIRPSVSYAIKMTGAGGNNMVSNNITRLFSDYGIYSTSNNNIISGNAIECLNGVYSKNNIIVSNNNIYSPGGIAINNMAGEMVALGNRVIAGEQRGVEDYYLKNKGGVLNGDLEILGTASFSKGIKSKGAINIADLPVYKDNTEALKSNQSKGTVYRTPLGDLKIVY
ncbi:hypothetical protein CLV98_101573 [Dyadobacter jejuensis]|uniref:Parallel beta helix pectate lyase-like protein n=1 Tax=Dyadobacter jejuensis TaxID=1082580 RepID=A0A316ASU5_9BACT|nr:hypothetical protein [Dyadobacter jejuensis]PWJ60389.1 hypothetical protein CLV98_101573 [Dyadobacter jejuensis]